MIKAKSDLWSDIPLESKREMWRLYLVFNSYSHIFFGDSFTSHDSCEEVEVEGGVQWVYKWNDPSDAPIEAENGVLKLPIFTPDMENEDYYKQDLEELNLDEPLGFTLKNGEVIWDEDEHEDNADSS